MVQKTFEDKQIGSTVEHWKLGDRSAIHELIAYNRQMPEANCST
jgi:hypothetical protein